LFARADDALLPVRKLSESAVAAGFVEHIVDPDGHVRSVPLFMEFDGRIVPQLGFALACRMLAAKPSDIRISADSVTLVGKGKLEESGAKRTPLDDTDSRISLIQSLLEMFGMDIPEGTKPEDAGEDPVVRRTIASVEALRLARREQLNLKRQLDSQRDELRRI